MLVLKLSDILIRYFISLLQNIVKSYYFLVNKIPSFSFDIFLNYKLSLLLFLQIQFKIVFQHFGGKINQILFLEFCLF